MSKSKPKHSLLPKGILAEARELSVLEWYEKHWTLYPNQAERLAELRKRLKRA